MNALPENCPNNEHSIRSIEYEIYFLAAEMVAYISSSVAMNAASAAGVFTGAAIFAPVTGGGSMAVAAGVVVTMSALNYGASMAFDMHVNTSYDIIMDKIAALECGGGQDEDDSGGGGQNGGSQDGSGHGFNRDTPYKNGNPIIDPSGYVYEAVPSNRIEGVRVEAYYLDNGEAVFWDAENYEQYNPLYTDSEGCYHWDVPFGRWMVKYSKEGYLDTDSSNCSASEPDGYMPVPPPQLEVNVGMVSTELPTVSNINYYPDQIQIMFSQYMQIDSVNCDNIKLHDKTGGINGHIEAINAEYDYEGVNRYASAFAFIPDHELVGEVSIQITGAVNYADNTMIGTSAYSGDVTIKPESISTVESVSVRYNSSKELEVRILPEGSWANKEVCVLSASPSILGVNTDVTVTDENGIATLEVYGILPGKAELEVSLPGTEVSTTVSANIVTDEVMKCEKVTADVPSGSDVSKGTAVTLETPTEGARIYYTLDGSCPCVESASRYEYTAPITINEDCFIIAYAVKDGYEDSATQGFMYTVKFENPFTDIKDQYWYYNAVIYCAQNGLMTGTASDKFAPTSNVTRAQMVQILFNMEGQKKEEHQGSTGFDDVKPGLWYSPAIKWAKQTGVTSGLTPTTFGPAKQMTRQELAQFMKAYTEFKGKDTSNRAELSGFADANKVASWARPAMQWAVAEGIISGSGSAGALYLKPLNVAKRNELAVIISNYDKKIA